MAERNGSRVDDRRMRSRTVKVLGLASSLAIALAGAPALAQTAEARPAGQGDTERSDSAIPEIIVTANKRGSENIQDVPLSIQALGSETLDKMGVTSFSDYARAVPGLNFSERGPGDKRYIIRGVNSTGAGTVGVYYDEAVITGGNKEDGGGRNVDIKLYDIERIEVLKGPQGTLYGANSMSGTIRIVTNKPRMDRVEGSVRGVASSTDHGGFNYDIYGMVNVPIVEDKLAVRAVGWTVNQSGFIDNVRLGVPNLNREETDGFRVQVRARPIDDLTLTLGVTQQSMEIGAPSHYEPTTGFLKTLEYARNPWSDKATIYSGVLEYTAGVGTFTASTDLFKRKINYFQDTTRFFAALFGVPVDQCCFGPNFGPSATTQPQTRDLWDSEVRFASNFGGPFEFVAGFFHEQEDRDFDSGTVAIDPATGNPRTPLNYVFRRHATQNVKQSAVFGEATIKPTEALTLTAGLRYFWSSLRGDGQSLVGFPFLPAQPKSDPVIGENSKLTPKFGISYKITPDVMIYANAAQGFRIGGVNDPGILLVPNLPRSFGPDSAWLYEVGLKSAFADGRLVFNGVVYSMRWSKMQNQTLDASQFVFTTNAGKAQIDGVEFDLAAEPTDGLKLSLGASYAHARLTEDAPLLSQTSFTGKKGNRIPNVPDWTANAQLDYSWKLSDDAEGYFFVNGSYTGSSYIRLRPDDPTNYKLDDYVLVDAKLGLTSGRIDVSLFVNNLFNRIAAVDASVNTLGFARLYSNRPRTFGVSADLRF